MRRQFGSHMERVPVPRSIRLGSRHLYGQLTPEGVRVSSYNFSCHQDTLWRRDPLPCFLDIWINLSCDFRIRSFELELDLKSNSFCIGFCGPHEVDLIFNNGGEYRFIHFQLGIRFVMDNLPETSGNLHEIVGFLEARDKPPNRALGETKQLSHTLRDFALSLESPPVVAAARGLWYRAKAHELMAEILFEPKGQELFCSRQKRLSTERVDRVKRLIRDSIVEPPSLPDIAKMVGCSPYYLSRTFSKETGMTIPQYIREIRIDRAAELLRTGQCNVTEAAFEVGYNSSSHFSQAFCQKFGVCPAMYTKTLV